MIRLLSYNVTAFGRRLCRKKCWRQAQLQYRNQWRGFSRVILQPPSSKYWAPIIYWNSIIPRSYFNRASHLGINSWSNSWSRSSPASQTHNSTASTIPDNNTSTKTPPSTANTASNTPHKTVAIGTDTPSVSSIPLVDSVYNILAIVNKFNKGLSKLKSDFLTSLHIQEAEITRLHLQRRLHYQHEKQRRRLRLHEKHGVRILNEEGNEVAFLPSNVFTVHKYNSQSHHQLQNQHSQNQHHWNYYQSHYLSTRRPQEHLRQISRDLQTTLPTVAGFVCIPFVGYSFILLGMMFPRWLLSRQFHSSEQRWEFATNEYGERRRWWTRLNDDFWGSCMRSMPELVLCNDISGRSEDEKNKTQFIPPFLEEFSCAEIDAAGPVFDEQSMVTFRNLFQDLNITTYSGNDTRNIDASAFVNLPTTYLHSLSLSSNFSSTILLPSSTLAPWFLQAFFPSKYLQHRLLKISEDIIMDDAALLEEGQLDDGCDDMTDDEVLDACWLRGLPVGRFANSSAVGNENTATKEREIGSMRNLLTNHLRMMSFVMVDEGSGLSSRGSLVRDSSLQLLVLHLPAIRHQMMVHSKRCSRMTKMHLK